MPFLSNQQTTLIAKTEGQDCLLGSIEYACHALHYLIASRALARLRHRLAFALRRYILRQGTSTLATGCTPTDPSPSILLSLSSLLCETRYTLRLLGLFPIWKQGVELVDSPSKDVISNVLDACQIASVTVYQLLENIAYLGSKDIIPDYCIRRLGGIDRLYLGSIRGLLAHFVVQLVKLGRAKLWSMKDTGGASAPTPQAAEGKRALGSDDCDEGARSQGQEWRKDLVSSSLWTVLCIHWSFPHDVQRMEKLEGALSFLADFFLLRDSWIEAAA
ncbi:hypothetical protein N7470_003068 [Penicillium chermesinum]|nr:hypothetical protein N7470_003068 [Penicillium chermesinum]